MARSSRRRDDSGMGLVMVIAVAAMIATMVVAGIAMALSAQRGGRHTQDWDAALAAAYGGVEEYRSLLTSDASYWRYGNPEAPFTTASGSAADVVLPPVTNPAFGLGPSGTWGQVGGSDGTARFRYEVDASSYQSLGLIRLRSTGSVGTESRSVVASISQEGFIKYLYWSDYEISQDMAMSTACAGKADGTWNTASPNWNAALNRLNYRWENNGAGRDDMSCGIIYWSNTDVLGGPFYTNDTPYFCDATFNGPVRTLTPGSPKYRPLPAIYGACGTPHFNAGVPETPDAAVLLPPTNAEMKREVRTDLPDSVPSPGCLYTGPTSITFTGDGYMTVRSRWTIKTQVSGDNHTAGTTPAMCGTPGTATGQLGSPGGARVPVVEGSLVYVQNVPTAAGNVNTPALGVNATTMNSYCDSTTGASNGLGYPLAGEFHNTASALLPWYGCTTGDVFVKGAIDGHMSIASENNLWVVGDVTRANDDSLLGLVANTAIVIWNPLTTSYTLPAGGPPAGNRTIEAAMVSVNGSFAVQNYDRGPRRGNLVVYGSMASKWIGATETTGGTGYGTAYSYDQRLNNIAPPKFLKPTITTFVANEFAEVPAAFDATGNSSGR